VHDFQRDLMFLLHDVARLLRVDAGGEEEESQPDENAPHDVLPLDTAVTACAPCAGVSLCARNVRKGRVGMTERA